MESVDRSTNYYKHHWPNSIDHPINKLPKLFNQLNNTIDPQTVKMQRMISLGSTSNQSVNRSYSKGRLFTHPLFTSGPNENIHLGHFHRPERELIPNVEGTKCSYDNKYTDYNYRRCQVEEVLLQSNNQEMTGKPIKRVSRNSTKLFFGSLMIFCDYNT